MATQMLPVSSMTIPVPVMPALPAQTPPGASLVELSVATHGVSGTSADDASEPRACASGIPQANIVPVAHVGGVFADSDLAVSIHGRLAPHQTVEPAAGNDFRHGREPRMCAFVNPVLVGKPCAS